MVFFKRIIPESQLPSLKDYTFKPGNFTFIDNLMLKYFWEPVVNFLPKWLSANLLTLFGGLCVFIMNCLVFYYVPNFKTKSVPKWTSLLSSFLVFFYTTFDGIDGIQARRLGLASPLGQLLDHGTDALVCSFFCYFTFLVKPTGFSHVNTLINVSALINAAAVNWQEENFGTFSYTNSFFIFGVSEPLLAVALILMSDYFFPSFWLSPISKFVTKHKSLKFMLKYLPKDLDFFTPFLYFALSISYFTFFGFPYEMYKLHRNLKKTMKLAMYLLFNCILPTLLIDFLPPSLHVSYSLFASTLGGFGIIFIIISNIRRSERLLFYPEFYPHYMVVLVGYLLVLGRVVLGLKFDALVFKSPYLKPLLTTLTLLGTALSLTKAIRVLYEIKTYLCLPFFTTKRPENRSK
ncbi:ethanolamine phosphotransferase, putative [Theileria annulata]|uniref:Ethanolamine phosphotransferase, putative n=1 Tax=Theileria annulata TaxID=5874 RepID=Q4UJ17_THEAN|nr:ethanolamine phosphotransferase, putative [Theileria annulata]CAI72922.1 ethanolamine phosphotransferase, putative [Theileria annulata]|eukprot:XP_953600.1 ethanolamine phosphotransferase, putative [Theileria annulata]